MKRMNTEYKKIENAIFLIMGEIVDIYKGKKADYHTVRVHSEGSKFYDLYNIRVPERNADFEIGDICKYIGTMSTYYDKSTNTRKTNMNATNIETKQI